MPLNFDISIPEACRIPFLCPSPAVSSSALSYADAATVSVWLRNYNNQFSRFERIANNGLYSILEKEVENITPLLNEGQKISISPTHYSGISQMINDLVRPRLTQLQTKFASAQKNLAEHEEEKKADLRLAEKWAEHGLPASVLEYHADCARFLIESKLAFDIVGFRETSHNPNEHNVKLDPRDNHPMLKMRGEWKRWETITREIHYDAKAKQIKSLNCPSSLVQTWSYSHRDGLVPEDRASWTQPYPVYELSGEEYQRVRQYALKFYETNPEKDPGILKDCIVQFYTVDHRNLPKGAIFDNAQRNYPLHIGMRVITADRKVYSFGVQMPPEEQEFVFSDYFSTFLATVDGKIEMRDFEEFRADSRNVTSIPLTPQRAQNILNRIKEINEKQYRFQYMRQNCANLASEVIQLAGYNVDMRTSAKDFFLDTFPSLTQIPLIKTICDCAQNIWKGMPALITKPIEFTADVILFVPRKIGTILTNLFVLKLGGAKKSTPLEGVEDEEFYDKGKIQYFSSVIRSWTDIFSDEVNAVYSSKYFVDWQKKQHSTFYDVHEKGHPKMAIVPPRS